MRILTNWLEEFVELPEKTGELARRLTDIGLEVDQIINFSQLNRGIRTTKVLDKKSHPDRDELLICLVSDGEQEAEIVTAAPRVKRGGIYLWAPPGSELASGNVEKKKFAGIQSRGMLCSSRELGLTREAKGLLELPDSVETGRPAEEVLELNEPVLELDLTPNRPDCLSHLGVARDFAAAENLTLNDPRPETLPEGQQANFEIKIEAPEKCWKYTGIEVENLAVSAASFAIQKRILKMGLRPLNNLVDTTNYTLFEVGHPLHPFDADKLNYPVIIRRANPGEQLETLDGEELNLVDDDLVIADSRRAVALAGVMGGAGTQITSRTTNLLLEGAYFEPTGIRTTASRHKLHTEASHRFERGADPRNCDRALARCLELLQEDPAQSNQELVIKSPVISQTDNYTPVNISFEPDSFEKLIGYRVESEQIFKKFNQLGLTVDNSNSEWKITAPSWRPDLEREEDLIEEIVRLDGYENIPVTYPELTLERTPDRTDKQEEEIRDYFVAHGFNENITFSFVHEDHHKFGLVSNPRRLTNPLAETQATMRQTILDGLLGSLEKNYAAGEENLRLFELGRVFPPEKEAEPEHLAWLIHDQIYQEKWDDKNRQFDFYDARGLTVHLLQNLRYEDILFRETERPGFVAAKTAEIVVAGKPVGWLGKIEPELLEYEYTFPVFGAELNLATLPAPPAREYLPFSTQPPVKRDLDLVVDKTQPVRPMEEMIHQRGKWLEDLVIFDVYSGDPLPPDKKSVSFSLQFRADRRSLSDREVNEIQENILNGLRENFGAELRDE